MSISSRTYVVILLVALVLPPLGVLGYNLYIDPFQLFHQDQAGPDTLLNKNGSDRIQHAATIRNYSFDSVILGNSHAANYLPSHVEKTLDTKQAMSLTMNGSTIFEQSIVARQALRKQPITHVLWGVSPFFLSSSATHTNNKFIFPLYLYDKYRFNDLKFFLTFDLLKYQRQRNSRKHALQGKDLAQEFDRTNTWYHEKKASFNRPLAVAKGIIKRWRTLRYTKYQLTQLKPIGKTIKDEVASTDSEFLSNMLEQGRMNIETNIISLVSQYPQTQFDFVFTPFPLLRLQCFKLFRYENYLEILSTTNLFVDLMSRFDNVRIFMFDLAGFTNDLRLYKDGSHFHIEVNNYILEAIAKGENQITSATIDQHLIDLDRKVSLYRLPARWNPKKRKKIKYKGSEISNQAARRLIEAKELVIDNAPL